MSNVTELESLVVVTVAPGLPERSLNEETENGTRPSVSPDVIVYVADQDVGPPETAAACVAIVTVGAVIDSDEVNDNVILSPTFAFVIFALLDCT